MKRGPTGPEWFDLNFRWRAKGMNGLFARSTKAFRPLQGALQEGCPGAVVREQNTGQTASGALDEHRDRVTSLRPNGA